jgi:hypothetical protein
VPARDEQRRHLRPEVLGIGRVELGDGHAGAGEEHRASGDDLARHGPARQAAAVTVPEDREAYRRLPDPVRPEDVVETVDTSPAPAPDASDEREVFLREAGG